MRLGLRRQMIVCPRMTSLRLRFFGLVLDTQIIQRAGHSLSTLLGADGVVVQAHHVAHFVEDFFVASLLLTLHDECLPYS